MDDERARFLELAPDVEDLRPVDECFDERLEVIIELGCDETETSPFDWETRTCPLWPSFLGFGESCVPPPEPGGVGAGCRSGLVCDAASRRCVNPFMAPGVGQPCLFSSDSYDPPGVCARVLTCGPDDICIEGDDAPAGPEAPSILCSDDLYVF